MENNDLVNSQGQLVSFGLYNCLDPNAKCQVKVVRAKRIKVKVEKNRLRTVSGVTSIKDRSKEKEYFGHQSNIVFKDRDSKWRESQRLLEDFGRESPYDVYR